MSWYTRWASKATQKAHARVTRENARYVREAIERDAENERLTQERDAAVRAFEAEAQANTNLEAQLAAKDELIARMDAELSEVSGRLSDALERNALIDREEDMRDEVRAKRASDGMGDD